MATLLGAGISTVTAFIVLNLGQRADRKKRAEERLAIEASHAISGFIKLTQWTNLLANIKQHIDRFYHEAQQDGLQTTEACLIVGPSAGQFTEPEKLKAEEFAFLAMEKESDLLGSVQLLEARAQNTNHVLNDYSRLRMEFEIWLESLPGFQRKLDGRLTEDRFPAEHKGNWDIRVAQLNVLIGELIGQIDDEINFAEQTVNRFSEVARRRFGDRFPKISFDMKPV
ncbi:hypothetical protein [Aliiroseovarius crassostreae]|uniref:hypothetical protein n=1 Tax=Aliiroseovarius crassostreae TaxID=154981 RepID=UPI003C79E4CB